MRQPLIVLLAIFALIAGACGGASKSEDSVLHLERLDVSEADWRSYMRGALLEPGAEEMCKGLTGLSAKEAREALRPNGSETPSREDVEDVPGGRYVPNQEATSGERAAQIILDECDRVGY